MLDINYRDDDGWTSLMWLGAREAHRFVKQCHYAEINSADNNGTAAQRHLCRLVLMDMLSVCSTSSLFALHRISRSHTVIQLRVSHIAPITLHVCSSYRNTSLNTNIVKALRMLEEGVLDINYRDDDGWTSLMLRGACEAHRFVTQCHDAEINSADNP